MDRIDPRSEKSTDQEVSRLFQAAVLQGEKLRISGMMAALAFLMVLMAIRAASHATLYQLFWKTQPVLAGVFLFEAVLRYRLHRAERQKRFLSLWAIAVPIVVETSLPTLVLFIMVTASGLNAYSFLTAPVVLLYFLFLILSTLRLNPRMCILAGLAAGGGYLALASYVYLSHPYPPGEDILLGIYAHGTYVVLLMLGGALAAVVAGKIRHEVAHGVFQIEQRQRLEADLEAARSIQRGLLPRGVPPLADYEAAGQSWPADQTGGDYYDWMKLPNDRWIFTIADVTGHGIGPALLAANCHAYVHAVFGTEGDIHRWISRINQFLAQDLEPGLFITFLGVELNPENGELSLLSAGHGPTLLYRASGGTVEELPTQGLPLGLVADFAYDIPLVFHLEPGDVLMLMTDGIAEWTNRRNEQFGVERAAAFLRDEAGRDAKEIIERLRNCVMLFAEGTGQKDDLTVVVIKRRGSCSGGERSSA